MNRRQFLLTAANGLAGVCLTGFNGLAYQRKRPLGVQLYSVRAAVAQNLEGTLEKLAKIGFGELEIYGYDGTFFGHSVKQFKTLLANTGFKVIGSHHGTGRLHRDKGSFCNAWQNTVEDLHQIGAAYAVCAWLAPEERTAEGYRTLPELLEKTADAAKPAGITLAYHNHDFEFESFEGATAYDFLIQNTNANLVKMELDLYWITKAGFDPVAYFEKYPGRFPLWHVKDMQAGTEDFAAVGDGTIDFDRIFAARHRAGLKHWFVEQDESKRDIFESLKRSAEHAAKKRY